MNSLADHIVSGYDSDLNELTASLSDLGSLSESMVADSVQALKMRDETIARSVIERDHRANAMQAKIDADAMRILALRNPMATDLRRTIGAIRVATDLERIGDLAEGIAKRAINLNDHARLDQADSVAMMGRQVKAQLSAALDALLRDDMRTAMQVWMADTDIDDMYNAILRDLLTSMTADPGMINGATAMLFAAKNLERIGDHTSNLCEVIYFTGRGTQLIDDDAVQAVLQRPDRS
ncbi:phosphate signaling complex protein PhoU [Algimonas porphyrae]|uniref:Phosphate-specific transport system accessory protein PhoU n=1 Tax=Algimonas porphyrae TaxID=1128113 RepID=A0ABQ5UXF0_9PROT|nr:phosphate signaling complex protein PhoU [Algimonas porphyrae]GLQ19980.1 phosphate transport system regulatory protein PhoU [Algimonas porphyrae]